MNEWHITILGLPLAWKAPYVSCRGAYGPRTNYIKDVREKLILGHKEGLLEGAIEADFFFFMPIPKSASKKKRDLMMKGEIRPTSTPDRSNMLKLYEDILQSVYYENDSFIVGGRVEKWYDLQPRTEILLKPAIQKKPCLPLQSLCV